MNKPVQNFPHRAISFGDYDILVPFVCRRCGNCCRNYDPIVELEMLPEIALCLGEPIAAIQRRLGANSLAHDAGQPTDCCFLHPRHSGCIIYEIRPTSCRQFPPLTGVGAGDVDCPGYREYSRVRNEFTAHLQKTHRGPAPAARVRRPIPPDARKVLLHRLAETGVSDGYRKVFEALNR
jgi:Fe-S-cluster containining protein